MAKVAKGPLYHALHEKRSLLAQIAQDVYDEWRQDEEGLDEEYGSGGICDAIAVAWQDRVILDYADENGDPVANVLSMIGGQEGDDHAPVIFFDDQDAVLVDLPASVYEVGGGYSWKKRLGVKITAKNIVLEPVERTLVENPAGLTKKGERMYRHIKKGYGSDPRAKEIAARTVYARASEGVPGLRRANPPRAGEMGNAILSSMSNTLWVTSYADWAERIAEDDPDLYERLRDRGRVPRPGGRWDDVVPEPPSGARQAARTLLRLFEEENQTSIEDLLSRAVEADKKPFPPSAEYTELFGHYLAMEALGHGVSWFDDHKRFSIKFPRFEAWTDGRILEWSPH